MDATREDLIQFISAIRCKLHGPTGLVGDPVQTETLDQLKRQLVRLMLAKTSLEAQVDRLKDRVENLTRSVTSAAM